MNKELSIYVHIPFCKSKCYYCDFCSSDKENEDCTRRYIDAVIKEILDNSEILSQNRIKTIYFGGGTPSYIDEKYIEQILGVIRLFTADPPDEITIELNPADCSYNKLIKYLELGINRFSIGMQSANDDILKVIGRRHKKSDVVLAINNMVDAGIENISLDVITGLPNETLGTFKETLSFISSLGQKIKHISMYSLEVHENTKLSTLIETGFVNMPTEDEERTMNDMAYDTLSKLGYTLYEISNYSRDGYNSMHNLNYWNQGYYLGFGCAAASYINGRRYTNVSDINEYISRVNNSKNLVEDFEELDKLGTIKEYIILKLRLASGINLKEFSKRFGNDICEMYGNELEELIQKGLLEKNKGNIYLSRRGRDVANLVWEKFI